MMEPELKYFNLEDFESRGSGIAYAMIDCNNFYASCERAFNPSLQHKPIAILSNNDGCVIARSAEAKEAGIPMGAPEFKYRSFFREKGVVVRSSNYALYGDMSQRVMDTLRHLCHDIEVYSIDEAFAEISRNIEDDLNHYGRKMKETVLQWTGLPVSVGIAPSKTLAKVANQIAKKNPEFGGVLNLCSHPDLDLMLKQIPLQDIWGIGKGLTVRLNRHDITNAFELKQTIHNKKWVRKHLKVTGLRTVMELNGLPCMKLSEGLDARKGILSSRMFGKPLFELEPIQEAVATFVTRAAEKLRAQHSVASNIHVTLVGDKYDNLKGKYKYSRGFNLKIPTASTSKLIQAANALTRGLYMPETKYKKASVMLTGLVPNSEVQTDLFEPERYTQKQHRLMECLDQINAQHGRNRAAFAATGLHKKEGHQNIWKMKQNHLSQKYTTSWDELMEARAQ